MPRLTLFVGAVALALLALAGSASAATYFVTETGTDVGDCIASPCETVEYAIEQHRLAPEPDDVIDVGPGTFDANFAADDPDDDGLTIRGTLDGETRATTLRGVGDGADDSGVAFPLGVVAGCLPSEVTLRDANVDTDGADPSVMALELDGGSDLVNVQASNQPGSTANGVVLACERGTVIQRSEIVATDDDSAIAVADAIRLVDSTVTAETEGFPAIVQFSGGDPNVELRIRRSRVSTAENSIAPAVFSGSRLVVDSSLITGGLQGVQTFDGVDWLINNSTIDAGQAGVSDPDSTPSLFLDPFGGTADVTVDSSILVDGIEAPSGDGTAVCTNSDMPSTEQGGTFVIDCPTGPGTTNTTTDPAELFAGGSPYDWQLPPDSPAIDTGQPGAVPAGLAIRDLAGNPRRAAGTTATCPDGTRDKGAYEFVGPPCAIQPPEILNGDAPVPGDVLSSNRGTWTDAPTGHLRQWLRCDADGDNCTEVTDYRTRKNYRVRRPDVGSTLRVRVIATNAAGDSEPATSDPSGLVSDPP
jgi:hypothetical protein